MALACAKKSSLTELAPVQWCKCCAAARNENANVDCSRNASLRPIVWFASAIHARALHAHDKPWFPWKTRKGQRARTCVTSHAVQKVPVRNLAFHVMPRQRLYPDDFGRITIFTWPLPWHYMKCLEFSAIYCKRQISTKISGVAGMPRSA